VGDEFFMTHGHVHRLFEGEAYFTFLAMYPRLAGHDYTPDRRAHSGRSPVGR